MMTPEVELAVIPGQPDLFQRKATWDKPETEFREGKFRGVILLNAYGYRDLGTEFSYKGHPLNTGNKDDFLTAFFEDRRKEELDILNHLTTILQVAPNKMWFMTAVVKEDLWWPKRSDAEKHYRAEEYGKLIQNHLQQRDPHRFRHEFVFASLVIANLVTTYNERLKSNAEGYDHQLQVNSLRRLFQTLESLQQ